MHRRRLIPLFFSVATPLCALSEAPWFGDLYQFKAGATTFYEHAGGVHNRKGRENPSFSRKGVIIDLETFYSSAFSETPKPAWNFQFEQEIDLGRKQKTAFSSTAVSARKLLFDDVYGDVVSLAVGGNMRFAPRAALVDPLIPYHGIVNAEANFSVGKEFSQYNTWVGRAHFFGSLGMCERGSFWSKTHLYVEANGRDQFQFALFLKGYFGLGGKEKVNLSNFKGWSHIAHRSVDGGILAKYHLREYGHLECELALRMYSKSYTESFKRLSLRYVLPFSVF